MRGANRFYIRTLCSPHAGRRRRSVLTDKRWGGGDGNETKKGEERGSAAFPAWVETHEIMPDPGQSVTGKAPKELLCAPEVRFRTEGYEARKEEGVRGNEMKKLDAAVLRQDLFISKDGMKPRKASCSWNTGVTSPCAGLSAGVKSGN